MKQFVKDYSLSLVLFALFLACWIGQAVSEWQVLALEAEQHGEQSVKMADFVWHFAQSSLENWTSEYLQLFSFVVLTAFLIHRGSHESKDSADEFQAQVTKEFWRLNQRLDKMEWEQQRLVGDSK